MRAAMAARKSARFLAPIALVAVIAGTYVIVHKGLTTKSTPTHHPASRHRPKGKYARKRFYVIQGGDSMTSIAARTGVAARARRPRGCQPPLPQVGDRQLVEHLFNSFAHQRRQHPCVLHAERHLVLHHFGHHLRLGILKDQPHNFAHFSRAYLNGSLPAPIAPQ